MEIKVRRFELKANSESEDALFRELNPKESHDLNTIFVKIMKKYDDGELPEEKELYEGIVSLRESIIDRDIFSKSILAVGEPYHDGYMERFSIYSANGYLRIGTHSNDTNGDQYDPGHPVNATFTEFLEETLDNL